MKSLYHKWMPSRIWIWKQEAQIKYCKGLFDNDASRDLILLGSFKLGLLLFLLEFLLVTKFYYSPTSLFPQVLLLLELIFSEYEIVRDKPVLYVARLKQTNNSQKRITFLF